jgi:hypothetical protein
MLRWLDRHIAIIVVLVMLELNGIGVAVYLVAKSSQDTSHTAQEASRIALAASDATRKLALRLAEDSRNQLINRGANVETWCVGGINEGRQYDRRFVESFHAHYTLSDKDCTALIRKTLESPKRKAAITRQGNPITFRVAKELRLQR